MSESAKCLQCTHPNDRANHQCGRYTYPHATFRCNCICQRPDELRQLRGEVSR